MAKQGAKTATPRLRFPEFRGANGWHVKPLESVCEVLNNRRRPITSSERVPGPYPYYGASGVVDFVNDYIFDERLLLVGEDGAKWGRFESTAFVAEGKYWVNNHAHVLKAIEVKDTLLENYLTMLDIGPFVTGAAPPKLTLAKLKRIPIPVPPTATEQQKIADCLTSLDEVIAAQGRKVEALKAHKRGLMQQLFPREGEARPRLRFPEFRDEPEWKPGRLGDIANISKGKGISKADITADGRTPCVRYGELYTIYGEVIDRPLSRTNVSSDELVLSEAGDVIVPASGETKEDIATSAVVISAGVALGGDLNIIRADIDGKFLSYYLNGAKRRALAKVAQGDTVVHLYPRQLEQLDVAIPLDESEQQRIADCLSSLDTQITAETNQLAALKTHKQGLMQQLFPAPEAASA